MRRFLRLGAGPALLAALALVLTAAAPRVPRGLMQGIERAFDARVQRLNIDDPFDLLGPARGVYLDKFGAVLTAEVNLVTGPAITPFRPQLTPEEKERLRQKKLQRLGAIRQVMRDSMVSAATALKMVPEDEQVVVGVTFFYHPWELMAGLPSQVVMQARRKALVDYEAGRIPKPALEAAIQEQVY